MESNECETLDFSTKLPGLNLMSRNKVKKLLPPWGQGREIRNSMLKRWNDLSGDGEIESNEFSPLILPTKLASSNLISRDKAKNSFFNGGRRGEGESGNFIITAIRNEMFFSDNYSKTELNYNNLKTIRRFQLDYDWIRKDKIIRNLRLKWSFIFVTKTLKYSEESLRNSVCSFIRKFHREITFHWRKLLDV